MGEGRGEAALQSGEFVSCPAHMVTTCLMCGGGGGREGEGLRDEMREAALQSGEFVSCPAHMVTTGLMCGGGVGRGEGLRDEGGRPAVWGVHQLPCAHGNTLFNVGREGGVKGEGLRDEMREAALQSGEIVSCPAHMVTTGLMCGMGGG